MIPSERIKEIHEHLESIRNSDRSSYGYKMKEKYGTANNKIISIIRYLDEEYDKKIT